MKLKRFLGIGLSLIMTVTSINVCAAMETVTEEGLELIEDKTASDSALELSPKDFVMIEDDINADLESYYDVNTFDVKISSIPNILTGETTDNIYLMLYPNQEIKEGNKFIINLHNAKVSDDLPKFGEEIEIDSNFDSYVGSYEEMMEKYKEVEQYYKQHYNYMGNNAWKEAAKFALDGAWGWYLYACIPYRLTKLSDTSIEVEMFPLPNFMVNEFFDASYDINDKNEHININFGKPHFNIPIKAVCTNEGRASVSLSSCNVNESDEYMFASVYNRPDDFGSNAYISDKSPSNIDFYIDKQKLNENYKYVKNGETIDNLYMKITPYSKVNAVDKIIVTFENGEVNADQQQLENIQDNTISYDECIEIYKNDFNPKIYEDYLDPKDSLSKATEDSLQYFWSNKLVKFPYIPWKTTVVDNNKIEIELFPLPDTMSNIPINISENSEQNEIPYYYIPLTVTSKGTGDITAFINTNGAGGIDNGRKKIAEIGDTPSEIPEYEPKYIGITKVDDLVLGETSEDTELVIVPHDKIDAGDKITVEFENVSVPEQLNTFENTVDSTGIFTFDYFMEQYNEDPTDKNAQSILNNFWKNRNTSVTEVSEMLRWRINKILPWKITRISPHKIEIELFPIDQSMCVDKELYKLNGMEKRITPQYRIPLSITASDIGEAFIKINGQDALNESGTIKCAVVRKDENDKTDYVPNTPPNSYVSLNRVSRVKAGEAIDSDVFLNIVPNYHIGTEKNRVNIDEGIYEPESIILKFENAKVSETLPRIEDLQLSELKEDLDDTENLFEYLLEDIINAYYNTDIAFMDEYIHSSIFDLIWTNEYEDLYIPWEMERISDSEIRVKLYPVPETICGFDGVDSFTSGSFFKSEGLTAYYSIPLPVIAENPGDIYVKINGNGTCISSGKLKFAVAEGTSSESKPGDIDKDNTITAKDANYVLFNSASTRDFDETEKMSADVDNDGSVTAKDANYILFASAGLRELENKKSN